MADPLFPIGLPGPEWTSLKWTPAFDNRLRTTFPGAIKTRPRVTRVPERLSCTLWLTAAELQVLLDFHDITCRWTLPFQWWDFRRPNDTNQRAIYTFYARPDHTAVDDLYQVQVELQIERTFSGSFPLSGEGGDLLNQDDEGITT